MLNSIRKLKSSYSHFVDAVLLLWKDKKDYWDFFTKELQQISSECKRREIYKLRPIHMEVWKLKYGTAYFSGELCKAHNTQKVFIKIQGPLLKDCFANEVTVNHYIKEHSEYLYERCPKVIDSFCIGKHYLIIYEFLLLAPVSNDEEFLNTVSETLEEYRRVGIVHTDFGLSNMGQIDGKNYFFDYGTAICPESDSIRIRLNYNHIDMISMQAKQQINGATYYYDDAVHFGIQHKECNYIVGDSSIFFAVLCGKVLRFKASESNGVKLLKKEIRNNDE